MRALPLLHDPGQQRHTAGLHGKRAARAPAFGRGLIAKLAQLLAYGGLFAAQPRRQERTDGGQRTGAGQHHPQAPQGQDSGLRFAQVGQVGLDDQGPFGHTGVARHQYPPWGDGRHATSHTMPHRGVSCHLLYAVVPSHIKNLRPAGPHPSPRRHTPMPPHATACPGAPAMCQPSAPLWAVAEIFRLYDETYRRAHPVPPAPQRVRRELAACRTVPLGGHAEPCLPCGVERYTYKACRNRHGPKCQTFPKGQWGEDRKAELLPVPYCHLVFTVPHDLNSLMLAHKRPLLTLLFNAASQTLVQFGHHHLGGQSGGTMGLHTWDQTWGAHCHGHCLMAAGALAANGVLWSEAEPRFLLPVRALSPVLRGKFCAALARVGSTGAVPLAEAPTAKGPSEDCAQLRAQLYTKEGGVHAKAPLAGPAHLLDDVGRYPQRVAIANHRLLDVRDGCVRFASRNRRP